MSRFKELKRLDRKSRNKLRHILSVGGSDALTRIGQLRGTLGALQSAALEEVLSSPATVQGIERNSPFPKNPPFVDRLHATQYRPLGKLLKDIEISVGNNIRRLVDLAGELKRIDHALTSRAYGVGIDLVANVIRNYGWSHAILRRLVLIRENFPQIDEELEELIQQAGLQSNAVVVASLIHAYSPDQSYLTIKRSISNIIDRGAINRYSRAVARIAAHPFARDESDLANFLGEVLKCSLLDALILIKFNRHLIDFEGLSGVSDVISKFGDHSLVDKILDLYPVSDVESEITFFQQSTVWLEYDFVRDYRVLLDGYYDASRDVMERLSPELEEIIEERIGVPNLRELVGGGDLPFMGTRNLLS